MEKVIHVLPNYSAQGTLCEVLKIKGISEETLGFHHSLCHGIIPTRTTYEACVDDNFRFARPCERQWMKEDLARFYAVDFSEYEKVVVWHSNDSESQCFLYFMVSLISEMSKQDILYEADVTEILSSEELLRRSNPIDHTLQIECCTNSDFSEAINIISKVNSVRFEELMSRWRDLQNKSRLGVWRFVEDDNIVVLNEDWMDKVILKQLALNPTKHNLYRDIGEIIYRMDHIIGDYHIYARIKQKADEWGYHITYNRYIEKRVQ